MYPISFRIFTYLPIFTRSLLAGDELDGLELKKQVQENYAVKTSGRGSKRVKSPVSKGEMLYANSDLSKMRSDKKFEVIQEQLELWRSMFMSLYVSLCVHICV